MASVGEDGGGLEALHRLKSTDPPLFLTPSSDLSLSSRTASEFLFSSLKPYTPKSPFDQLLTNGFDSEQIWQQIDLQSQPLVSSLRREIRRFEKDPARISRGFEAFLSKVGLKRESAGAADVDLGLEQDDDEFDELEDGVDDEEEEEEEEDEEGEEDLKESSEDDDESDEDAMEEESEDNESGEEDDEEEEDGLELEDQFLKIKELEKYLRQDEKREYGSIKDKKAAGKKKSKQADEDDEEDESEDVEDEDDQHELFEDGGEDEELDNAKYEDFFVSKNEKPKRKPKQVDGPDNSDAEDEEKNEKKEGKLSRHEKEQKKLQAKIQEMEKANLDPKAWIMQGEVTAAKRPKNSALEADLDFEHNVRPPPVITEEVTASLEDIIKKRIVEGRFDDVQRAPKLSSKAPREFKELDENKSKKGLAEIYEEEYLQKAGFTPAALSFSEELKKEATTLFKRLCLKLDALSHYHFAPKPVVEDMSVETNLPALAMEEVAPVAVSDAAMLAPEEVFAGVGNIKEEAELTQEERKRRRAKKKRKFKAVEAKRASKKPRETPVITQGEGKVKVIKA